MKRNRVLALWVTAAVVTILLIPATSHTASASIVTDSFAALRTTISANSASV